MLPISVSSLFRRAKVRRSTALIAALVLALPAGALGAQVTTWYSQWTGGAALSVSGESIGSLPCYFTPAETTGLPGATPEQLALQTMPAIQCDVASSLVFDVVTSAVGNGYAFVGPSASTEGNARLRVFGDLNGVLDPKPFAVRTNTLSWRVGSSFAGATLVFSAIGKPATVQLAPTTLDIPLPVDSAMWSSLLASGPISLALVRADGLTATLQLALVNGQLQVLQNVP